MLGVFTVLRLISNRIGPLTKVNKCVCKRLTVFSVCILSVDIKNTLSQCLNSVSGNRSMTSSDVWTKQHEEFAKFAGLTPIVLTRMPQTFDPCVDPTSCGYDIAISALLSETHFAHDVIEG